jgi:hypothetical protein
MVSDGDMMFYGSCMWALGECHPTVAQIQKRMSSYNQPIKDFHIFSKGLVASWRET